MNGSESSHSHMQDNRLAGFADRLLAGEAKQVDPNAGDELEALEQTVLRLHQAFPAASLTPAQVQQMQARLQKRLSREGQNTTRRAWHLWPARAWQSGQPRRQMAALAGLALLAVAIFAATLQVASPAATGTAGLDTPGSTLAIAAVLLGMLAIALWSSRRK